MREVFQQELDEVQERLVEIAELVADAIDKATTRVQRVGRHPRRETVIADDHLIDELARQPRRARDRRSSPASSRSPATCASS